MEVPIISLSSSEGDIFEVRREVAMEMDLVGSILKEIPNPDTAVPLKNVGSKVLAMLLEHLNKSVDLKMASAKAAASAKASAEAGSSSAEAPAPAPAPAAPPADPSAPPSKKPKDEAQTKLLDEFVKKDNSTIFELILASNYLRMSEVLDALCEAIAKQIKGKSPEEIRTHFNIKNDFTAEEEEEVRRENQWAFE